MEVSFQGDLSTRDGFIEAIRCAGRYIEEHDARHPDEVPRAHEERRLYGDRLHGLGVAL